MLNAPIPINCWWTTKKFPFNRHLCHIIFLMVLLLVNGVITEENLINGTQNEMINGTQMDEIQQHTTKR